jgi:uncharacterized protein YjbI with pentapeptide repeats
MKSTATGTPLTGHQLYTDNLKVDTEAPRQIYQLMRIVKMFRYTEKWNLVWTVVVLSNVVLSNLVLSNVVLSNIVLSYVVLYNVVLSYVVLYNVVLSNVVLYNVVLSNIVLSNVVLSNVVLSYVVLSNVLLSNARREKCGTRRARNKARRYNRTSECNQ